MNYPVQTSCKITIAHHRYPVQFFSAQFGLRLHNLQSLRKAEVCAKSRVLESKYDELELNLFHIFKLYL
jgi:hypothetical protein